MLFPGPNTEVLAPMSTKYLTLQMGYGILGYFGDAAADSSYISGT